MFGFDIREAGSAYILMAVAILVVWVAFTGRLSNVLGALLTPGQMIEGSLYGAAAAASGVTEAQSNTVPGHAYEGG